MTKQIANLPIQYLNALPFLASAVDMVIQSLGALVCLLK